MPDRDDGRVTAATAAVVVPSGFGPLPGTLLGDRYRVSGILGIGGTGVVVKALDLQANDQVAIKLLRDDVEIDHDNLSRFLREATAAFRLRSEHAARVRDVGTFDDGRPFMVMEFLEGMDLGRLLAANLRLDRKFAVDLALQAADALAEAHGIGIVHRDVKPSNLFVTWRPDGTICTKVLDFGIAKSPRGSEQLLTGRSAVLGTPAYMSPEQMRSASTVDARTDVWSLGTVLFEMVEGQTPFQAASFAEMCARVSTEEPASMTVVPELAEIVNRCLAKDPGARFATVAELALALSTFGSDPTGAHASVPRMYRLVGRPAPYLTGSVTAMPEPARPTAVIAPATVRPARVAWIAACVVVAIGIGIAAALVAFGS